MIEELKKLCKPYKGYSVVYAFSDSDKVLYIGSTGNLLSRLITHNQPSHKHSIKNKTGKGLEYFNISVIIATKDHYSIKRLEQHAIDTYTFIAGNKPEYNIMRAYTEKPKHPYKDSF